jgi:class 3 adenylate cyclase
VLKIGAGDFSARVEASTNDEIGELSEAFNQMAEDLALKERYKNVLSQVTDASVATQLMRGEVELGGTSLDVTVLFCDIRGFTDFASNMEPHALVEVLNTHMTAMTKIAHAHGGVVDKFVGDEIMVLFGAPVPGEDDMRNAYTCAMEMIQCRREMNATAQYPIQIGIGMAHGPVIAGCMGSQNRLNYTVIGKAANLASRLCSEARQMEIALDLTIRDYLGDHLTQAVEVEKSIKGFDQLVTFYKLSI